ncbi:MAG: hypothetical protein JNK87_42625 [Bryobacterales bacterium]|nr:hypothetical protein [Bryobacterales bacterium]
MGLRFLCAALLATAAWGQSVTVRIVDHALMPAQVDSNSPAFWRDGQFHLLNSTGLGPVLSAGPDQFQLSWWARPDLGRQVNPTWIEAVWQDADGALFAWYHQERERVCGNVQRPAMPQIGAAVSYDGGLSFFDLGLILTSGDPLDCSSKNGYFAGGHGDFSVRLDRAQQYFYFVFTNYGGDVASQGVVVARMSFEDRFQPAGAVRKYYRGSWTEPGLSGRVTPVFRANVSWQEEATDSFWGASVHWNTHIEQYVMLLNRSCCEPGFPQEGIYISFNADIGDPGGWSTPLRIVENTGWYPQVLGLGYGETDSEAGERARLYIYGESWWELEFSREPRPE